MTSSFQTCQKTIRVLFLTLAPFCFTNSAPADLQQNAAPDERGATRLMHFSRPTPAKLPQQPAPVAQPPKPPAPPAPAVQPVMPKPAADVEPRVIDASATPSDAIVLFDGKDLSEWASGNGSEAKWAVADGVLTVTHTGAIHTRRAFGDCQLHLEWATPAIVVGDGQGRGNSGVFLQRRYEIQVLDSYNNKTYFDGQAGSVYKQYAPLVNASRKPGEWQTYDIIYHAPRFEADGKLTQPATVTVIQNGALVQDNVAIKGPTMSDNPKYSAHELKQPLELQDHGNPVRYRNIWIREL